MPNQAILHIVRAMMASHVVSPAYCRAASGELTPGHGHWRFYATRKNYTVTKLWVIIQKVFGMTELGLIQIYVLHGRSSQTLCSIGSLACVLCIIIITFHEIVSLFHHQNCWQTNLVQFKVSLLCLKYHPGNDCCDYACHV